MDPLTEDDVKEIEQLVAEEAKRLPPDVASIAFDRATGVVRRKYRDGRTRDVPAQSILAQLIAARGATRGG